MLGRLFSFHTAGLLAFCMLAVSANAHAQVLAEDELAQTKVDTESFKCADELMPSIDILGRGSDFPQFLIQDVFAELRRQDRDVKLLSIQCNSAPAITGVFAELEQDGETVKALDEVNVVFDVEMLVDTGTTVWIMHVDHAYKVSALSSGQPKVVQTFEVIETLNEDGSALEGPEIDIYRNTTNS